MTGPTVPEMLQAYAERGLFRDFQADSRAGEFRFVWMGHKPMRVNWKPASRTVTFKDVFPNVPPRGAMDRELRAFLQACSASELPAHRRVDPADFEIQCQNRQSSVSIGLKIAAGSQEEAVDKLMLIMHETFLMMHDRWLDYMHEEFGASLE